MSNSTGAKDRQERFYDLVADASRRIHKDQNVYWVDSTYSGQTAWSGRRLTAALPTIAAAEGKMVASQGDVMLISPFHTETVTAVLTIDKAYSRIEGLVCGNQRPVITGNGAIDVISLEANNCEVSGIEFGVPGTDAQTADINIAAANCLVKNTMHHGSTTALNKVDFITLTAAADDAKIDGCRMWNDTVEMDGGAISFEGACKRVEVCNCFVFDSVGLALGAIYDGATALGLYIHHNVLKNAKAATVVLEFGNNSTGICSFNHISGRHTTLASNVTTGTGMDFFENRVTEEAQLNGGIIPAADAD